MSKFIKSFILYIVFWIVIILLSITLIKDNNILLSILLIEIILVLLGILYLQAAFIGLRQKFTTEKMTQSISGEQLSPLSHHDLEASYKKASFTLKIIDDLRIYHKLFKTITNPSLKQPFLVSHLWLDHSLPIEKILDYHQLYVLNNYQDKKVQVGIFITFLTDNKKNSVFMESIIYDTSKRLNYYHVPVLITDDKTYMYETKSYTVNKQLSIIIEHLNETIRTKKF